MELKQSSAVPFAVTDPISGLDITKDVQLVSIESVGEGDFPYFQPNDDYTFTVVNASRDEIVAPTTFTLDVPYDGEVHRLTATTDMTISPTTDAFMKYQVLKPLGSVIVGPANSIITIEMQTSFRGITLTADDVVIQKHKPGTDPSAYPITFISATTKADGKTLDVKWQGADTMVGLFTFYVLRKTATGLVEGEDWVQVDMNLRFGISGLRIGPIHDSAEHIRGHQGELINGWFTVYNDGVPIKLNDPGLTLTLQAAGNINVIADVIAIDERFEDHITFKIKGKPNGIDVNEPAGTATGYFYIKATWKGVTAQVMPTLTWYPGTDMMSTAEMQLPLFPNQTQKAVTQFGPVNGNGITPWYTIEGATVRAGSIFVSKLDGSGVIQQVVVAPGTPLNSINQLVKEITTSWMKQRVALSGFVLDLPFITDRSLYQTMWRLNAETTIEMAPVEIVPNTTIVSGSAGGATGILLKAYQNRDGELVRIPSIWSNITVVGAGAYIQYIQTTEGDCLVRMTGRGVTGDISIKGTCQVEGTAAQQQQWFDVVIKADAAINLELVPKSVNVKMWDVLTEPPFTIKLDRVEAPQRITNVKAIKNAYIQQVQDKENEWEVYNAQTSSTTASTYFTYDLVLDSGVINQIGQGSYDIAAWNGIAIVPNAEYIPGDRTSKNPKVPLGGTYTYTFYPQYKGKLDLENIELRPITRTGIEFKGQKVNDEGTGIVVTLGIGTNYTTASITFYYQVKGIPIEELVNQKTVVSETVTLTAIQKGLYVEHSSPTPSYGGLGSTRNWQPAVYFDAVRLKLDDPRLDYVIEGHPNQAKFVEYAGSDATTIYLFTYRAATGSASWYQLATVKYTAPDGTVHSTVPSALTIGFSSGATTIPIMEVIGDPVANAENTLPTKFYVDPLSPFPAPKLIGRANVKITPAGSDVAVNGVEYLPEGALKFDSGWKGGEIFYLGTWEFPTVYSTQPVIIKVPPVPVDVTQATNQIDGIENRKTEIRFTLSQQRRVNGVTTNYNFTNAEIYPVGVVTGSVKQASAAFNNKGTFFVDVYGNGTQGPGTITMTITDDDGESIDIVLNVNAVIDSSPMSMVLENNVVEGVAGDVTTITGTVKYNDTDLRWDNSNGNMIYSVEPEGWVEFENGTAGTFDLRIVRNSPDDVTQVVNVTANFLGMTVSQPVTVNVKKNLTIEPKVFNVKVWERINGYPFVMKEGEVDITDTVLDCKPINDDVVIAVKMENRNKPAVNMWTVKGEGVLPARTEVVTWEYRLPTDLEGTKRTIDITYNVEAHNGYILTAVPQYPLYRYVASSQFQGDFFVYRRAEPVTEKPTNIGPISAPSIATADYTNFEGQGRFTFRSVNTSNTFEIPNSYSIRVGTGSVPGQDIVTVTFIITIYDFYNRSALSDFKPNPLVGRFGEEIPVTIKVWLSGNRNDVNNPSWQDPAFTPAGIVEMVPGSRTADGFKVRFLADITENSKDTEMTVSMRYMTEGTGRTTFTARQLAAHPKLTPAPGFESTGSGDMENPVTLKQGVLNPE